jgi:hypothetical protein
MRMPRRFVAAVAALFGAAVIAPLPAQEWEVGAGGGASFFNRREISGPAGGAEARFRPGIGFTAFLGQGGDRIGGEIRYAWFNNDMEIASAAGRTQMGGRNQTVLYNLLLYTRSRKSAARGYVLVGGGVRQFEGTGPDAAFQPAGRVAVLTRTSEWKPAVSVGGGVRLALRGKTHLRVEVLGLLSRPPTQVITPVAGNLGGWFFSVSPMAAVSYVF